MAESTNTTRRKSRIPNACDVCRRRKVRCDSATMPGNICTECIKWKTECTHKIFKRKRGPKAGSLRKPTMPKAKLNDLVTSIVDSVDSYILPNDIELVRTLVIDLALQVRSLEAELKEARESIQTEFSSTSSSVVSTPNNHHQNDSVGPGKQDVDPAEDDSDDSNDFDGLTDRFEVLSIFRNHHHGSSSTFKLLQNALDIKGQLIGEQLTLTVDTLKRPEFWSVPKWQTYIEPEYPPYVFPEDDLIRDLISLYFAKFHPYFPMLHRPTLEESFSQGLHRTDRGFGAIILMVCTLASQYSDDPRTLSPEARDSEHSKGWSYFRQIRLIHRLDQECDGEISIYEFQLYPLAAFYLHTTNIAGVAFLLVGIGIRAAHQKGVHERSFVIPDNRIETELWRRGFQCLIIFDVYGSVTLGKPRATSSEDSDWDFSGDYEEVWSETPPDDTGTITGTGMGQPVVKPSILSSFWTHYLKLFDIISFVLKSLYPSRNPELRYGMSISLEDWNRQAVIELDTALSKWVDSIPAHLKWNPHNLDEIFFHQSVLLHVTYYWAQFQVHKQFISRAGAGASQSTEDFSNWTFPSLTICANAARACISILDVHHRWKPFVPIPLLLGPLFDSGIVLLMNLWRGLRFSFSLNSTGSVRGPDSHSVVALDPRKEMEDVYRCGDMLGVYEKGFQCAGRLCDILNSIISVGQLPPFPERRSLKRSREIADEEANDSNTDTIGTGHRTRTGTTGDTTTLNNDDENRRNTSSSLFSREDQPGTVSQRSDGLEGRRYVSRSNGRGHIGANSPVASSGQLEAALSLLPYHSHQLGTLPLHLPPTSGSSLQSSSPWHPVSGFNTGLGLGLGVEGVHYPSGGDGAVSDIGAFAPLDADAHQFHPDPDAPPFSMWESAGNSIEFSQYMHRPEDWDLFMAGVDNLLQSVRH